jgi:hypothetical protein
MDTIAQPQEPSTDEDYDDLEARRRVIQLLLDEIANEVGTAMHDAHLDFPVGLTSPSSGHAILTMVTLLDPSDDDWERASAIVRQIVSEKLGGIRLRSRLLPCVLANATMTAADIAPNALDFNSRS